MIWDTDIADLKLSDEEKNGLQVFRNYQRAFDKRSGEIFAAEIDAIDYDISNISKVVELLRKEDFRLVPIIACAFVDDLLKNAFADLVERRNMGKPKDFLGPMGPLGDLAKRLTLAKLFDLFSADLVDDFDRLRKARNKIAHVWEQSGHEDLFLDGDASRITAIEDVFGEKLGSLGGEHNSISRLRVRTIWMTARAAYEVPLYLSAKDRRLNPVVALYEEPYPQRLKLISALAQDASKGAFFA